MSRAQLLFALPILCVSFHVFAGTVVINEIHYDPPDRTSLEEFLELYNSGGASVDLSGWYFSDGIEFTFPSGAGIGAGEFLVVALSPPALESKFGIKALGPFVGYLSSSGERIVLRNAAGGKEDEVNYKVGFPWPTGSAGRGSSMELINPLLDNDLGGSWRASGGSRLLPAERAYYLQAQDAQWHYRKGTSEASDPPSAWRAVGFAEDASWLIGKTSIGFADNDDSTVLDDMFGNYTSVYLRHSFTIASPGEIPRWLKLRLYVDDGAVVWINGVEVARSHVPPGELAYNAFGRANEAKWEEFLFENSAAYLTAGENVLAIHALNQALGSNDFSIDAELFIPSRSEVPPAPTPGEENSVSSTNAPPQVRQVEHLPAEPRSGKAIVINAKVTDPDGVAAVTMKYQVVAPGEYIPSHLALEPTELMARPTQELKPNPEFEDPASWTEVVLLDDGKAPDAIAGDGTFSGAIPPQPSRTLVRYRITASDKQSASVTVPYGDDHSLNFACFVYDGVPPFKASKASVHPEGAGHVYPVEVMNSLPVYFLITRTVEVARCVAYNSAWQIPKGNEAARDAFNWEGAFVYEGVVYDHIHYRLHQANDRYGASGKRAWRFRFHKGNRFQARDNQGEKYSTKWRTLNTGKMFDNKGVGNFGLTETMNEILWNMTGVPAPLMHTFHFRVVDGPDEVPAEVNGQYRGDFWGMALAIEDYDPRFLDAHGMPDGNLYKLKDGIFDGSKLKRNQGRFSVKTDADFQNIRSQLRPNKTDDWLDMHVNYDRWYPYHTVVEAIRHYDFVPADSHSKNRAWFFEPAEGSPLGRLWTLPWDSDASWGPNWNDGIDYSTQAIFGGAGKPAFKQEYRNFIREFRDLLWREDVINPMIDDLAAVIAEFSRADRDRWKGAPADAGSQDFGTMENKVLDMKKFAFVGWSGATGPTVPPGGRAKHLDNLAGAEQDLASIPKTPTVTAMGPAHFPIDGLVFQAPPFSDPQGDDTFGAMKWRLGEITSQSAPGLDPKKPRLLEWKAVWESEEIATFTSDVKIPLGKVLPDHTYRVRVKMMDNTAKWSHWSEPVEFTASEPDSQIAQEQYLRVTEVMYNPAEGADYEFLELQNTGPDPLDLTGVRFSGGIELSFAGSDVTTLGPGEFVVAVKNLGLFSSLYDVSKMKIAGEYSGRLDNGGEEVTLTYGDSLTILDFTYNDSWYSSTDGEGYSLVILDPKGRRELWSQKDGWRPSAHARGSPGEAEPEGPPVSGLQLPGDLSQDGKLNLSDAIGILGHLFRNFPASLPCGSGTLADPGNRALLDLDGNTKINITDAIFALRYLFQSGPPPVLGTVCVGIPGCPEKCAP